MAITYCNSGVIDLFYQLFNPFVSNNHSQRFTRSNIIYHQGDEAKNLYLVKKGLVGLFHTSEEGKEILLRVFTPGSMFGHRSHFARMPYHASAIAMDECEIDIITNTQCSDICSDNPNILREVTRLLALELGESELRVAGFRDKSANQRICEGLVYLKHKDNIHKWTREEIAEFTGSTYETVTRVMSSLEKANLLKKEARSFEILNNEDVLNFYKP